MADMVTLVFVVTVLLITAKPVLAELVESAIVLGTVATLVLDGQINKSSRATLGRPRKLIDLVSRRNPGGLATH
jgi:hypothetical protein